MDFRSSRRVKDTERGIPRRCGILHSLGGSVVPCFSLQRLLDFLSAGTATSFIAFSSRLSRNVTYLAIGNKGQRFRARIKPRKLPIFISTLNFCENYKTFVLLLVFFFFLIKKTTLCARMWLKRQTSSSSLTWFAITEPNCCHLSLAATSLEKSFENYEIRLFLLWVNEFLTLEADDESNI